MINEGLSYTEVMTSNSNVACAGICVRIMLFIVYLSESLWLRGSTCLRMRRQSQNKRNLGLKSQLLRISQRKIQCE